jgi:hypothetical protein
MRQKGSGPDLQRAQRIRHGQVLKARQENAGVDGDLKDSQNELSLKKAFGKALSVKVFPMD